MAIMPTEGDRTMTSETKAIIGIQMWRAKGRNLGEMVYAVPAQWSNEHGRPVGAGSKYDQPELDDLHFGGFVSDYMSGNSQNEPDWPYFYGSTPEYREVYSIDARRAQVMAAFLAKFDRATAKADAREAGDRFMIFAKQIGAQYVWMAKGPDYSADDWSRTSWVQLRVTEGRDRYRDLIRHAKATMRERLLGKATAA